ncbi:MAG TPA: peptidase, partial [Cyclobacteriaceae bacterium]
MLKTRIILVVASAVVIWLIFLLPKVVVENEATVAPDSSKSSPVKTDMHTKAPRKVIEKISRLRAKYLGGAGNKKNAIFADSLIKLYAEAGKFDSAAWFAEEASTFFNTTESWIKAGDNYY